MAQLWLPMVAAGASYIIPDRLFSGLGIRESDATTDTCRVCVKIQRKKLTNENKCKFSPKNGGNPA